MIEGRLWISKNDLTGIVLFFKGNRHFSFSRHFSSSGEQAFFSVFFKQDLFFIVAWFKVISVQHVLKYLADKGDGFKHMLK